MESRSQRPLVGRARERAAIGTAAEALSDGRGRVVVIVGEPGIGKSRLLGHLADRVETAGATVLGARASEFEGDLPFALWTEALDPHLAAAGDRRLSRLGLSDPEPLAAVLPALGPLAGRAAARDLEPAARADADRHRIHRALRDLVGRLAAVRPLVLCFDDVHWADPSSADVLAALVRRPPHGPVLLALAARTGRLPAAIAAALGDAARDDRLLSLDVMPLSEAEAAELVGDARIYARAGGNPFYLEQLARSGDSSPMRAAPDDDVPPPVAAALGAELAELGPEARRLLDGAAVAGDPFDPGLAAAVAELPEPDALRALDDLLAHALVRPAGAPRRFAFRHPVVRHAVYVGAAGGWRLGAHARAARALELQGAGPVQLAHHVEQSAAPGDAGAVALLTAAAAELRPLAPAGAARWYAAALRLLPAAAGGASPPARTEDRERAGSDAPGARTEDRERAGSDAPGTRTEDREPAGSDAPGARTADRDWAGSDTRGVRTEDREPVGSDARGARTEDRERAGSDARGARTEDRDWAGSDAPGASATQLRSRLADAQASGGDPLGARATLLDALRTAGPADRLALTVALANQEWRLGANADARRRLQVALGYLPAAPSPDRIRLRLALALTALMECELAEAQAQCQDARDDARAVGDPVTELAALACLAVARASAADPAAPAAIDASADVLERITPEQLATRLPALWMHGRARRSLGRFGDAVADLRRGAAIAADTGREAVLLLMTVESVAPLIQLGRIREAIDAADDGIELARLAANPQTLLWAHCALAEARLAAGDVGEALRHGEEAAALGTRPDFYAAGQPGWCLGAALTAAGNADQALPTLSDALGGPELPRVLPADRPAAASDLVEAHLALGEIAEAGRVLEHVPGASAATELARSAALHAAGRAEEAVRAAAAAREAASNAPLLAARADLAAGRALALAGDRPAAIDALTASEAAFDRFGARRRRDEAVRELRRLGRRVVRASAEGADGALTAREREIAALVSAGRTNREVAEQLVLSPRTIEAHLRSIYGKLGVRSRVELAGAMQRDSSA